MVKYKTSLRKKPHIYVIHICIVYTCLYYMQINFSNVKDYQLIQHLFYVISLSVKIKVSMQKAGDLSSDDLLIGEIY